MATAAHDIGAGTYTVVAQLAAAALDIAPERIRVLLGDTSLPRSPLAGGSTTAPSVGSAAHLAATEAARRVADYAIADPRSPLFGAARDDVACGANRLASRSMPDRTESVDEILRRRGFGRQRPLEVEGRYTPPAADADRWSRYASAVVSRDRVRVATIYPNLICPKQDDLSFEQEKEYLIKERPSPGHVIISSRSLVDGYGSLAEGRDEDDWSALGTQKQVSSRITDKTRLVVIFVHGYNTPVTKAIERGERLLSMVCEEDAQACPHARLYSFLWCCDLNLAQFRAAQDSGNRELLAYLRYLAGFVVWRKLDVAPGLCA